MWKAALRGLRPAVPAVIGAAALTFLFAAVMPLAWVAGISWNLYLDRLSDFFVPPIGNGGRLALALAMAAIAALIAGIVALIVAKPEETGFSSMRRRLHRRAEMASRRDDDSALPRRRADLHPDDPPRPPIRAGRDLPAEGLGPPTMPVVTPADGAAEMAFAAPADEYDYGDELVLADLAPTEPASTGDEPWLQPAEIATPTAMPDPADNSLGAMVARLEAGLARRRQADPASGAADAEPGTKAPPEVDFALEAALGTLQRMTRHAAG